MQNVLLIVTQDTKKEEAAFIREVLEGAGVTVIHMDPSVRQDLGGAEIGPDALAASLGLTMEDIRAIGHEGQILEKMTEAAIKVALELAERRPIAGILSIGGSMGTTLGTSVMRAFPYGVPKVMISTLSSGFTAGFVGVKDILMLNSVCDISGLNSISRDVYRNGALSVAGMARGYRHNSTQDRPLVLVSTLGTTESCARRVREGLEAAGCEVMVFHTTGNGGRTLETICAERDVALVIDMSLVEINDALNNGICAVGPERGRTAIGKGTPVIFAPGNIDFYIMPSQTAVGDDPYEGRAYHIHNSALTAVRTNEADLQRLANHMAELQADARSAVEFFVPLQGFSSHDSSEGRLHRPDLPPLFAAYCEKVFPANVRLRKIDAHINDALFAEGLIASARDLLAARRSVGAMV